MALRRLSRFSSLGFPPKFRPYVQRRWYLEDSQPEKPINLEKSLEEQKEALRLLIDDSTELKSDLKTTKFMAEIAFCMAFASGGFLLMISRA